jgi:hypothetical protein
MSTNEQPNGLSVAEAQKLLEEKERQDQVKLQAVVKAFEKFCDEHGVDLQVDGALAPMRDHPKAIVPVGVARWVIRENSKEEGRG